MARIKRKQYFIAARFQLKYIVYILLFLYIGAAVAGYTVYWTTWVTLGEKLANVYPRGRLIYIFKAANVTLLLRLLLITPIFIVIGTFLSHRIAGPIYRIGKYIDLLKQGDYTTCLVLRKKDELKILAKKMTELCVKLADDKEKRTDAAEALEKLLQNQQISGDVAKEIRSKINDLKS